MPKFNVQGRHCLSFAYHMYGFHIRTLQIAKKTADGSIVPLWLQAGEQGKRWLTSSLYVNLRQDDQVRPGY
ncbi:MAG: hypothetical protein GXO35_04305 [Gammaproteobacteria bacterium]|nr:hypothetical protein [Gammaproteobacteria bacterium]